MNDPARKLVNQLIKSGTGGLDVSTEVVETHISIVMLTPRFAYKLKKPVNYGFVDFSTLQKRKFYCQEELRLNKRLAQELYIDMVPVTGSVAEPAIDGEGQIVDYLVKMHRFSKNAELDKVIHSRLPVTNEFEKFAIELAGFHRNALVAERTSQFGLFETIVDAAKDNFRVLRDANLSTGIFNRISKVRAWSNLEALRCESSIRKRKEQGFIRECHGDLHLGNLVLLEQNIVAFDCLEFNAELRWIDVANELAFLLMDLSRVEKHSIASIVLNRYLECTDDYGLLSVLRFYMVYRAMVRAKVSSLGLRKDATKKEADSVIQPYLVVAEQVIVQSDRKAAVILMHGLSGCGKSWLSKKLKIIPGVIHIRSDIVRDRKLRASTQCSEVLPESTPPPESKYSTQSRTEVYRELERLADTILEAGYAVIVDATFLEQGDRQRFRKLALSADANFHIVHLDFPVSVLEERIASRMKKGEDPSEADIAVLHHQLKHHDVLSSEEKKFATVVNERSRLDEKGVSSIAEKLNLV